MGSDAPLPLDHPGPHRPHRVYVAVTNHCNRACPWCSTCSSLRGRTFLSQDGFARLLPAAGPFEVQLEGGEPTTHPGLADMVRAAWGTGRCARLVLCTNGVMLPREAAALRAFMATLGAPLTVKLAFNHHLLERDPGLPALVALARQELAELGGDRLLVLNVRLRRGVAQDDAAVRAEVEAAGLSACANVFYLQRYGLASGEAAWDPPVLVGHDFTLCNPDGQTYGTDLIARSDAMGRLP